MSDHKRVFFNEAKPTLIRIWHWLAFLLFIVSVTTVVFNKTMFKTKANINMVQTMVQEKGGTITPEQAKNVAHEYSDKLWTLHKYIGFGLVFLMLWRIVAELIIDKKKKIVSHIHNARVQPDTAVEKKHYLIVQYGYLIFYAMFFTMSVTGLILAFEDVEVLKPIHQIAKNIHSLIQWGMYGYMVLHIVGVIIADCTNHSGIISRMINGKEGDTN